MHKKVIDYIEKSISTTDIEEGIKVQKNSNGLVYLDTLDRSGVAAPFDIATDLDFSTAELKLQNGQPIMGQKINKYAVKSFQYLLNLPHFNGFTRNISFYSSVTGGLGGIVHTASMSIQVFTSVSALINQLQTVLNALTGASGLTFTITQNPQNGLIYDIAVAGGTFCFALQENDHTINSNYGVTRTKSLWNLPRSQTMQANKKMGPVFGFPTRYIDIVSDELNENQRIPSSELGPRSGLSLVHRIYLKYDDNFSQIFEGSGELEAIRWVRKQASKSISNITFRLYDEYGQLLILPRQEAETRVNSFINLVLLTE